MRDRNLAPTVPDEIRVTGQLHADACMTCTPETINGPPVAAVFFEIHPAKGMPYIVHQVFGPEPSAHIAADAKARTLKRGTAVRVFAQGLRAQSDHGYACLHLMKVTDVLPLSTNPAAYTEATTEKAQA